MTSILKKAYDPDDFRKRGHRLIDDLADHLERTLEEKSKNTTSWNPPEKEHVFWKEFLQSGDEGQFFKEVLNHTIHLHHPKYMGHQASPTAPITALSSMVGALLNNGMAVYEMGMAPTMIEKIITDLLCAKIGFGPDASGFLTSGGTLANLTALLTARKASASYDVWNEGNSKSLGIIVSEEAHYCVDRAAKIMGLGSQGVIKIPSNAMFSMDTSLLESYYNEALAKNIEIFAVVGSAPSTATGIYDDLEALADFSERHNLWFHVDGAHGGAALFSEKYKHTLKGMDRADSMVIDGHKMMMMPMITTALLFKKEQNSYATFSQKADYLLEQSAEKDWYNSGRRTFECTKTMMCLSWYILHKTYGEELFDAFVTTLYDLGLTFGDMVKEDPQFELAVAPMSNIVCFRYKDAHLDNVETDKINLGIRKTLLEESEYYIVQTKLRGRSYLRVTLMNPFTTRKHLTSLLSRIKELAKISQT
ncbi:pyridoxal phosphate-dependent decarboxylase family protein [Spongiimicrobium sp. 3-5]|uniref:pyridoxal phosphate-dependent decarboxylase family protein n=1 Tax=Spongiimicrobium sp. 3-5 TaxID=3332596 RepID=UPI0039802A54